MMRSVAASLFTLVLGGPLFGQEVLGETNFAGSKIVLRDDGSWQYSADDPARCVEIDTAIQWCGTADQWSRKPSHVADKTSVTFGNGQVQITSRNVWPAKSQEALIADALRHGDALQLSDGSVRLTVETSLGEATFYPVSTAVSEGLVSILPLEASDLVLTVEGAKGTSMTALKEATSSFLKGVKVEAGLYLKAYGNG